MGAETSSTQLIFFIVATGLAIAVSGLLTTQVYDIANKVTAKSDNLGNALVTDIEVVNDPGQVPNNPVLIYVKNTGDRVLEPTLVNVLIDGTDRTYTASLLNGATSWAPGDVAQFSIAVTLASGDHRVRVVTENGVADDFRYRI